MIMRRMLRPSHFNLIYIYICICIETEVKRKRILEKKNTKRSFIVFRLSVRIFFFSLPHRGRKKGCNLSKYPSKIVKQRRVERTKMKRIAEMGWGGEGYRTRKYPLFIRKTNVITRSELITNGVTLRSIFHCF